MVVIGRPKPRRLCSSKALTVCCLAVVASYPLSLWLLWPRLTSPSGSLRKRNNETFNSNSNKPIVIGYAVSITGCGSDPLSEGAAVLKHSIHLAHQKQPTYDYRMYAIVHPTALSCATPLKALGYTLLVRDVLVAVEDIQGDFVRQKIRSNGCCGEKELIKLEAYTLTQHPIVVHLDLDVLVLQPMDSLFDYMLASDPAPLDSLQWPDRPLPNVVNAFYTMDYNMVKPSIKYKPVQGGFLVLRPDQKVYEEFREIVRQGDFREGMGWGGEVGPFYGAMTFQGLIPYYYEHLHPGQSVELNRCIYNQMCDNPRTGRTVNDVVSGDCRTGAEECEDCRSRSLEEVVTTHYTLCQKPWFCVPHKLDAIQHRLCRKLTHAWYEVRSDMEKSWGRSGTGPGSFDTEHFYGYCKAPQKNGYIPIAEPYGKPAKY